jgi:hypothetical protein
MAFRESSTRLGVPYDNTVTRVTDEQRAQAVQGAQLTELVQNLYSICLYDTVADATLASPGLDPAARTDNAEYFFRVPPKLHEFQEPFATTIQGTQDGGKYVESYGSIIKSLRLQGTTGLRPNKSSSFVVPVLGVSEAQLGTLIGNGLNDSVRTIPADEKTGYDDIIFLRNIFRRYSDLKSSDALAGRVVMLWRNLKDADYWVVEPEDFRLTQNSSSPLTYEYSISLKTLARFDFSYSIPEDPLEQARARQRVLARLQEYGQNLLNIFMTVSNQINRLQGFASFLSNTVLAPILNVVNGLTAVKTSAFGVVRGLRTQAIVLQENLDSAIAQLVAADTFEVQDSVIRSFRRCQIICARILSEPVASESTTADVNLLIGRYAAAYDTPGTLTTPRRAPDSSPSYIGYETLPSTLGSDTVGPGESIRDVAARLLGDPSRWRILVTLNRLRAPFIAATGSAGVLAPGDRILFPRAGSAGAGSATVGTQNPTNNQYIGPDDPIVQAYGRDLMLRSTFIGGAELTDLSLNQGGDIASIQGIPNVEQALKLKFMTERGELAAHPKYGAKYPVGKKATPSSFNELRINTLNTLTSDNRIENVKDLRFIAVGDKLAAKVDIELVNARSILPVTLALRRF